MLKYFPSASNLNWFYFFGHLWVHITIDHLVVIFKATTAVLHFNRVEVHTTYVTLYCHVLFLTLCFLKWIQSLLQILSLLIIILTMWILSVVRKNLFILSFYGNFFLSTVRSKVRVSCRAPALELSVTAGWMLAAKELPSRPVIGQCQHCVLPVPPDSMQTVCCVTALIT